MEYRKLGNTGISVSEVAFGGVSIGMPYAGQPMPPESYSINLLHKALDEGINYFDTARMYGSSEDLMGKAFYDRRDQVVINTKCIHLLDEHGHLPQDLEIKKTITDSLDRSLKALRTDYIDVFMLHQSSPEILQNEEVMLAFTHLKQSGKVRAIGASTYTIEESKIAIDSGVWQVIQVPFNLMDQQQRTLFSSASNQGIGLIIRSVLFRGLLTGKDLNLPPSLKEVEDYILRFRAMNEDPVTLAMKFVLSYPEVSSILVGIDQMNHLTKALEAADHKYFDGEFLGELESMAYPNPSFLNFSHWVKNGWLKN